MQNKYDVVVIGAGPAGLTAGLYLSRAGLSCVLIEKAQPGGQLWLSEKIENYPGFKDGISSMELASSMESQAKSFGADIINDEVVEIIPGDIFGIKTASGKEIESMAVIIATGATMKKLGVDGEEVLSGKGVSYCAICDGPLFKDKVVVVVGGGNTACEEADYLTRFASKVYLVHRRPRLRAVGSIVKKIEDNPKIELLLEKNIKAISGSELVEKIVFDDGSEIEAQGVFIFIGYDPATGFLKGLIDMENEQIRTDGDLSTTKEGIFAAGDCRYGVLRQVVTACGDGALAAEEAREFVEKKKGIAYDW